MEVKAAAARFAKGLTPSVPSVKAKWQRIDSIGLPRSSHSVSVIAGRAYIFGGETKPREPVDNDMHIITLPSGTVTSADYRSKPAEPQTAGGAVPEKRVGHTAAVIGERIFVFGGRGGTDMGPLEEDGRVWVYDTRRDAWTHLDPVEGTPYPEARSYHASTAIKKPQPDNMSAVFIDQGVETPPPGAIAEGAKTDEDLGGYGTLFIHGGCASSGRINDLWGFDVNSRTWKQYPDAPGSPRGGASIAVSKQRIFRYGGFSDQGEEGGKLDFMELELQTFTDKGGIGELGLSPRGGWTTLDFQEESMNCPGNRSVAGLHTVNVGMGREYLILMLGEKSPSSQGHEGAGEFWNDIWAFQCPPLGMTAASLKDATLQALGRETGEGLWSQVETADAEGAEGEEVHKLVPGGRGWFGSSSLGDIDAGGLFLWGGLNSKNEREDNGWILTVSGLA